MGGAFSFPVAAVITNCEFLVSYADAVLAYPFPALPRDRTHADQGPLWSRRRQQSCAWSTRLWIAWRWIWPNGRVERPLVLADGQCERGQGAQWVLSRGEDASS